MCVCLHVCTCTYMCKIIILKADSVEYFFLVRILEVFVRKEGEIKVLFLDYKRRIRSSFPQKHFPDISHQFEDNFYLSSAFGEIIPLKCQTYWSFLNSCHYLFKKSDSEKGNIFFSEDG